MSIFKIPAQLIKYPQRVTCLLSTIFLTYSFSSLAQNTVYTPLYNSGNFVKTIDFNKSVGEIAGSASASASGGVTYSIPIFTCPGTNGLQPSISLTYNSQASSGIAGYGWNISGLSVISRTGKNIYHNGIVAPVTYTAADAFLLDGMRLNAISGANGGNGTIYAGEAESFAKIISYEGNFPDNPGWFQVTAKDGTIMEFGTSAESRVLSENQSDVMMWRLSKIIDVNGNYIEFKYDFTGRDSRIQQILYTGNWNTGLVPYNQINFTYSERADQNTIYEAWASLSSKYLLDKITVIHTNDANVNETVKTYKLNYGFDNVNSMLKEIVEFGGDENSQSLNSTIFLYSDPNGDLYADETAQFDGECITGDFNADGKTDILASTYYYDNLVKYSSGYKIFLEPHSNIPLYQKTFDPGHIVVENKKFVNFLAGDYNRDGRDDVVNVKTKFVTYPSGGTNWVAERFNIEFTTATGSVTQEMPMPVGNIINPSGNFFIPGDFDGDGNQDYITIFASRGPGSQMNSYYGYICTPGTIFANYGINQFTVTPGTDWSANSIATADKILPFDLDGDGKQEVLVVKGNQTFIISVRPQNSNTYLATIILTTTQIVAGDRLFPGDFNGDGKSDLLVRQSSGQWIVLYSRGTNFSSSPFYFNQNVSMNGNYWDDKIVVGDFNGDGKSDIAHGFRIWVNGSSTSSKFSLYYSKGVGTLAWFYEQFIYNNVLPYTDLATGDFNGDGRTDILSKNFYYGAPDIIYFRQYVHERLLEKITTGHNVTSTFTYWPLTSSYVYQRTVPLNDPVNQNPFNYIQLPMYVLKATAQPDGAGGLDITHYSYENAVMHRAGKGFMGFKKITAENYVSGITSIVENEINTQFAVPYSVRQTTSLTATNQLLSESLINNSFQNLSTGNHDIRYLQKIDKTLSIDYLNDKASESVNTYDSYGNITNKTTKVGILSGNTVNPTETIVSVSAFSMHNTPVPAKPDYVTVTNTRSGMPAISATTTFTYTANGLQASQKSFSGLPKAVTTTYTYNSFGNPLTATTSSAGLSNRSANSTYDAKGRFVLALQKTGAGLSHTESYTVSTKWGTPLTKTSTDCLTTTNEYDAFGRLNHSILPDGNEVTINDYWQTLDVPFIPNTDKLFYTKTHYLGGKPDTKNYIDRFGHNWLQQTVSMYGTDGAWHTMRTTYDNRGNVKTKTNLYFPLVPVPIAGSGNTASLIQPVETPRITTYNYDLYNRVSSIVNDIGTISYAYNQTGNGKMQTTVTNMAGQSSSQIVDATGKVVSSIDNGGQLDFTYDSRGNQKEVNQSGTILVSTVYDEYGRQISLTDINAGTTAYNYDAYGQLKQQTDALGNTYNMNYDDFGRIINRAGPEGTTSYEYYQHSSGCGNNKPTRITGFNGVIKEYTYDGLTRLATEIQTIDGTAYTTSYLYNNFSQLTQTTYPSGLPVFQTYDANGYLSTVYHSYGAPKNSLFANSWVDGEGKFLTYDLGLTKTTTKTYNKDFPATTSTPGVQNLTYNFEETTGNLLQRTDNLRGQTEYFSFDNLNRLATTTPNNTQQLGITYDASGTNSMGNIVAKTDAGYYKYRNDKKHALAYTMNQPVPGQSPVFPAPVSETPLTEQLITYTPFLKTASISENNYLLNLTYGPDYERVKTELSQYGNSEETRYFMGNYEKQIVNGIITNTREIHYVSGGNGICAILVKENGVITSYIVYTDHLGSITTVTDRGGTTIVAEINFDAWGRLRDPNNWNTIYPANTNLTSPGWLYRGYTGHEILPHFSLINMNGRMYDPVLGRMLSPDNYVSASNSTQGYNRYTYAMNNPLKFTDPDGNWVHLVIGAIIGGVVNLASGALQGTIKSWGDGFKAFGIGAVQGALSAAIGYGGFGTAAAGRAVAGGFLTSSTSVGANLTSTAFIGNIATGIASSCMPSIPFGDNFSVSPAFAFGTHGLSGGLSANYRKGNFSVGVGFSNGGNNSRFSYGGGWDDGNIGFSYSRNKFYGQYPQTTGTFGFRFGSISGSWENDRFADGGDRWRTNGLGLGYTFKNGSSAFIGSRFMTGMDDGSDIPVGGTYTEIEGTNAPREGLFYGGFTNANGVGFSAGIDSEKGLHKGQNWIHDLLNKIGSGDRYFPDLGRPISAFYRYGNANQFTYFY